MHVLIAPNAFKNSLDATAAAEAIQKGLLQSKLKCVCECFPIGDGGDGTAALLIQRCRGTVVSVDAHDPLGRNIQTTIGLIENGRTAVIEMADASGLRLLRPEEFNPLRATTFGAGELIKSALDRGVSGIILGIGGSATIDGGTGILQALGVKFLDAHGKSLIRLPEDLVALESIDFSGLDKRISHCPLTVLCDVENPLLGENGAARVFGPQKGATAATMEKLEAALAKLREVMFRQTGREMTAVKHGGAAGGVAAGLHCFLNAKLVNGIEYFLDVTGFDDALRIADLIITGEGSLDEQTLRGKGPFGVALRGKLRNVPVIGLAGRLPLKPVAQLQQYFLELLTIGPPDAELNKALLNTAIDLQRTAMDLGNRLAAKACIYPFIDTAE